MKEELETKVDPNKGLMRKTKTELVEIILRKDDVERKLQKELKEANYAKSIEEGKAATFENNYRVLNVKFDKLYNENLTLEEDFEKVCDENADLYASLKYSTRKYKIINFILIGLLLMGVIYMLFIVY